MREGARIPDSGLVLATLEGARWLVELLADTTVRVTLDRGALSGSIFHRGERAGVRPRLAIDSDGRDTTAVDDAVRTIA